MVDAQWQSRSFSGSSGSWTVAHQSNLKPTIDGGVFYDTAQYDYHLISVVDAGFTDRRLSAQIEVTPCPTADTHLHIDSWGGVSLADIAADGTVLPGGGANRVEVAAVEGGRLQISLSWASRSHAIFVGTSDRQGRAIYVGSGRAQWTIHHMEVEARPLEPAPESRLVLVDVGAAGGLDPLWKPVASHLHCVFVEPDPQQAAALSSDLFKYPSAEVLQAALSDGDKIQDLNIARLSGCSSLLAPDFSELGRYAVAPCFEILRTAPVSCKRYDSIPDAPAPDMIKVDVQGAEREVLNGFGRHLDSVLGVELEAHFYPIYKGQALIGELVSMMADRGLRLRDVRPQRNFDRDYVEVNAYFTKEGALSEQGERKRSLIHDVLGLSVHLGGEHLTTLFRDSVSR